jgi:hypothetical protein
MEWHAERGDEAAFLATLGAHQQHDEDRFQRKLEALRDLLREPDDWQGGPSRRLQLSPLEIVRIAEDSEPDGTLSLVQLSAGNV